jgi:flagellar biosynthetic protein FliP
MLAALAPLAITIGLLVLVLHLLRRLQPGGTRAGRSSFPLTVLRRVSLGPKQGLTVVRCGSRVLVVGSADQNVQLVTELSGEDAVAALAAEPPSRRAAEPPGRAIEPPSFTRLLRKATGFVVLLAVAGALPARAQDPVVPAPRVTEVIPTTPSVPKPAARPSAQPAAAAAGPRVTPPNAPSIDLQVKDGAGGLRLSGTVGLVVFLGAMTLLPALFLLMTSFTRILIVLHFVRSAIGTQVTPPGQLLVAIAVLLTGVVMQPAMQRANTEAIQPYLDGTITQVEAYKAAVVPFREFMLANTREQDIASLAELSVADSVDSAEDLPTVTLVSAFVVSELRTAFQMGFVIFLPFIVLDLIVASVLMSMGMFMLPPAMVSLPFKLLLFVLADGWTLVVRNLVLSFHR